MAANSARAFSATAAPSKSPPATVAANACVPATKSTWAARACGLSGRAYPSFNATVSRRHAHIRSAEGEYRLSGDGSEFGTRIFRDGRSIEVPSGDRRGERLRPGDEIYLGRACLRFER